MDNIIENNKLIAKFMYNNLYNEDSLGDCWVETNEGYVNFYIDKAKYHLSWDWLMPVVSLCLSKLDVLLHKNVKDSYTDLEWEYLGKIASFKEKFKWTFEKPIIENCFNQVIEFIKWYNETF